MSYLPPMTNGVYREMSLDRANKIPKWLRRRLWLLRRNKKNERHKKRKMTLSISHRKDEKIQPLIQDARRKDKVKGKIITLPQELDFDENYEMTVQYFGTLRRAAKTGDRKLRSLKFDNLKRISPSAALVLASEVDLWNKTIGGKLKAHVHLWQDDIKRLLSQMGYFELLQVEGPCALVAQKNTTFLPFKRGTAGVKGGELARELRIEIEGIVGHRIKRHLLFEGLSEAITNVVQHAYEEAKSHKYWWLSGSYDRNEKRLCVTFYDQGRGIPRTLPTTRFFERIQQNWLHSWTDAQKIEAAMEAGRTSTGLPERGKGLQNFVEFAREHKEGFLSILSDRGMYRMRWLSGNRRPESTERKVFKHSIGGTLIEWSVKL